MADLFFKINGTDYPIPVFDSFSIDECRIFYEWTQIHVEEADDTPVNSMMVAAFMQIAYMRGNPGIKPQAARDLVGQSNFVEALEAFNAVAEDDADPPELRPSELKQPASLENRNESKRSSGNASTISSDTRASDPMDGGSGRSEVSAAFRSLTSAS